MKLFLQGLFATFAGAAFWSSHSTSRADVLDRGHYLNSGETTILNADAWGKGTFVAASNSGTILQSCHIGPPMVRETRFPGDGNFEIPVACTVERNDRLQVTTKPGGAQLDRPDEFRADERDTERS